MEKILTSARAMSLGMAVWPHSFRKDGGFPFPSGKMGIFPISSKKMEMFPIPSEKMEIFPIPSERMAAHSALVPYLLILYVVQGKIARIW